MNETNPVVNIINALAKASQPSCGCGGVKLSDNGTYFPLIKRVVFNNPATIVEFEDGTKSVVKTSKGDTFDKERGVLYAIVKRLYGAVDKRGNVSGDGLSTALPRLIKEAWDQPVEERRMKKEKEERRLANLAKQKADHVAAKERKIKRLASEIEHWMEAVEYLKQKGVNVSPVLINEIMGNPMSASKTATVVTEKKTEDGTVPVEVKKFSDMTAAERKAYWAAVNK